MGRPPKTDRPVSVRISIPTSILRELDDRLADPLTERPPLGARSNLITTLIRDWLNRGLRPEE